MRFHREDWLGGYGSFKRRLYRLGHISFFGLAILNLLFFFTFQSVNRETPGIQIASWAFAVGALTMPLCCLLVAHFPKWRPAFALPVLSLVAAGILTLNGILHL
jgi:hypothetical protein